MAPDLDYAARDGAAAQAACAEMIDPATAPERKTPLKHGLGECRKRGTLAMVRLARFLAS